MDNNDAQQETLMRYLDGELSGEASAAFERQLGENADLQAELDNLQLAKLAVTHYGLKARVAAVHGSMMQELNAGAAKTSTIKVYPFMRTTLKIAASLFIAMFLFTAYQYVSVTPAKLFAENYQSYELSTARGASGASALEADYKLGNFAVAVADFNKIGKPGAKDYFLVAQAYLALHKPVNAIANFDAADHDPENGDFKEDAEYYLAAAYLENNQPARAEVLFNKIYRDQDHLYHKKVTFWTMLRIKLLVLKNGGQ